MASQDWPEVTKYAGLVCAQAHRQELIQDLYKTWHDPQRGTMHGGMIKYVVHGLIYAFFFSNISLLFFDEYFEKLCSINMRIAVFHMSKMLCFCISGNCLFHSAEQQDRNLSVLSSTGNVFNKLLTLRCDLLQFPLQIFFSYVNSRVGME